MAICKTYLRIEQHRLADRLTVTWDIDRLPTDALIPPLSLQPLLENMIYHGIERLPEGGEIQIRGEFDGTLLTLHFINPVPADDITDPHKGNKLAQENIRQRLIALFGKHSQLDIEHDASQYKVILTVPYKTL